MSLAVGQCWGHLISRQHSQVKWKNFAGSPTEPNQPWGTAWHGWFTIPSGPIPWPAAVTVSRHAAPGERLSRRAELLSPGHTLIDSVRLLAVVIEFSTSLSFKSKAMVSAQRVVKVASMLAWSETEEQWPSLRWTVPILWSTHGLVLFSMFPDRKLGKLAVRFVDSKGSVVKHPNHSQNA